MKSSLLDKAASVAVIAAALMVAYSAFSRRSPAATGGGTAVDFYTEWRSFLPFGVRIGNAGAPVKLIESADYECSFCARYHTAIEALRSDYGDSLEYIVVHAPLAQHRFAVPAARAAECANEQGRFTQMQDALYQHQDSLGFFSWAKFAELAGVHDLSEFDACIREPRSLERVDSGAALTARLQIPGTPTFVVNGHSVTGGGPDTLRSLIVSSLRGRNRD